MPGMKRKRWSARCSTIGRLTVSAAMGCRGTLRGRCGGVCLKQVRTHTSISHERFVMATRERGFVGTISDKSISAHRMTKSINVRLK